MNKFIILFFTCFTVFASPENEMIFINKSNIHQWGEVSCSSTVGFGGISECKVFILNKPILHECYRLNAMELYRGEDISSMVPILSSSIINSLQPYEVTVFTSKNEKTMLSLSYSKTNDYCPYSALVTEPVILDLLHWEI
ncbi:hypothetical protein [uncultured Shewanella sp.]|uniref:hypothetical protein n=1 Tax=uncultured Shewanella sp. TaxID=173975 RepID=UPI002616A4A8|nr:hypothetical protein [uncultured Shewanella sp.]